MSHSWSVGVRGSAEESRSPPIAAENTLSIDTRTDPVSDLQLIGGDGQDEKIRRDSRDNPVSVLLLLAADGGVEKFDSGASRRMTGDPTRNQSEGLKIFLKSYPVRKLLRVNNRTYEVDNTAYTTLREKAGASVLRIR